MVKPHWDTEELIENWTLLRKELELVSNKVGANQIGFAVLLKYFQLFARFPDSNSEIPDLIISYISSQLNLPDSLYSEYNWQGRSISNHRAQIRKLFGFRTAAISDSEEIINWLIEEVLPNEQKIDPLQEFVYQRFRELQIEPPTPGQVERLIRSAIHQHETNFCHQTVDKLTPKIIAQIDILLATEQPSHTENTESEKLTSVKLKPSDFAFLKTDPGPVGLGSFLTEIEKLKRIRAVGLLEKDSDGHERINRINYEISVLKALRERLCCKEIWVVGASRYRNPDDDLPTDFEQHRQVYYQALTLPEDVETFIKSGEKEQQPVPVIASTLARGHRI